MQIKKFLKEQITSTEKINGIITPNSLPNEIILVLNERIADEYRAHYFYRNAANWCKDKNYKKAALFFDSESNSELEHSKGIENYLTQWNVIPELSPVEAVDNFESLVDIINKAYELEYELLMKYSKDQTLFLSAHISSFNFIQQYVNKQNDSVAEYSDLLNALRLVNFEDKFQILYFENNYF